MMNQMIIKRFAHKVQTSRPFWPKKRSFAERNRQFLQAHQDKRLNLAPAVERAGQWKLPQSPPDPKVLTKERKLPSLVESALPYQKYPEMKKTDRDILGVWNDPLFNPHLHEERYRVNPEDEPFNAIYTDSKSEATNDYTKVRNITTPELWEYVEQLARIKIAPEPPRRKAGEKPYSMPSGWVPPPESPPDLPYFVSRTRNYLLPVYYMLHSDPEMCCTIIKQVTGDIWKFEEDLRTHLEQLSGSDRRILSSVYETDELIRFRGKHIQPIVDWLHEKGF